MRCFHRIGLSSKILMRRKSVIETRIAYKLGRQESAWVSTSLTSFNRRKNWTAYLHLLPSQIVERADRIIRSYLWAYVVKHPLNLGYGGSLSNNRLARWSKLRSWLPTFNRVEIYDPNDETWTHNKGEKNRKKYGQMPVPIPHGPCP